MTPCLIVLSGLPAVGKTTIARQIAQASGAAHLRIDTIEAVLQRAKVSFAGPRGDLAYRVAYAQAQDLLALGQSVVVDAVHGWPEATALWTQALTDTEAHLLRVALVCSDLRAHRARVETRVADTPAMALPDWAAVQSRAFSPLTDPDLEIDTAKLHPHAAAELILDQARVRTDHA